MEKKKKKEKESISGVRWHYSVKKKEIVGIDPSSS